MIYKAGCDPSGGGADEFTWAIVHRDGDRIVVDLVGARGRRGRLPLNPETAVADCASDLKTYRITEVVGDRYAAQWVVEAFRKYGIVYRHSERTKSELYLELLPLITAGRVEFPLDVELLRQAKLLQRRRGAQGKDAVDAPPGGHDDRINAAILALVQVAGEVVTITPSMFQSFGPRATAPGRIFSVLPDDDAPRHNSSDRPWDPGVLDDPFRPDD